MKKGNYLLVILAILSLATCIGLILYISNILNYIFVSIILVNLTLIFLLFYEVGRKFGKGLNLKKKDIKIGTKIKVLYCLSEQRESKMQHYFLIKMEDGDAVLLTEKEQVLICNETYLLDNKKIWEKVT